jgi:hypothetical protein
MAFAGSLMALIKGSELELLQVSLSRQHSRSS